MPKRAKDVHANDNEEMMKLMLKDLCSISQAATILGTDESHVRRLARSKRIDALKIDTAWVVYRPSLITYKNTKSKRGRPRGGSQE